jgi:hypothetical protein
VSKLGAQRAQNASGSGRATHGRYPTWSTGDGGGGGQKGSPKKTPPGELPAANTTTSTVGISEHAHPQAPAARALGLLLERQVGSTTAEHAHLISKMPLSELTRDGSMMRRGTSANRKGS